MRRESNSYYVGSRLNGFGNRITDSNPSKLSRSKRVNSSLDPALNRTHNLKHNHQSCVEKGDVFAKTASKLHQTNFIHHDNQNCLCKECKCGRHFCKLKIVKPDLTKNTIYQRSFYKQHLIPNEVNHDKQYDKLKGPHLDINSVYRTGYLGMGGDKIQRLHPEDLLHSNGPAAQLSSYSSQFPGYRGDNQYVKKTDRHARGYFPLRSKSTYADNFVKKQAKGDDYEYFKDQLKTGYNWFGRTTYSNFFSDPNPQYMAKKVKIIDKKEDNPNFDHQYQTVYKNDFTRKESTLCPNKIQLQSKDKGKLNDSKHNFAQNTDFKSFSPDFHAISTSKHFYV